MRHSADTATPVAERARQVAPVVWLLGKVQSGKTSIIRELTQASNAEIGSGFEACTRTARVFDFPSEAPIIRFLDTRGLGEVAYDADEDIAFCEERAHLVLAVAPSSIATGRRCCSC
jgi:predicted GTPase